MWGPMRTACSTLATRRARWAGSRHAWRRRLGVLHVFGGQAWGGGGAMQAAGGGRRLPAIASVARTFCTLLPPHPPPTPSHVVHPCGAAPWLQAYEQLPPRGTPAFRKLFDVGSLLAAVMPDRSAPPAVAPPGLSAHPKHYQLQAGLHFLSCRLSCRPAFACILPGGSALRCAAAGSRFSSLLYVSVLPVPEPKHLAPSVPYPEAGCLSRGCCRGCSGCWTGSARATRWGAASCTCTPPGSSWWRRAASCSTCTACSTSCRTASTRVGGD